MIKSIIVPIKFQPVGIILLLSVLLLLGCDRTSSEEKEITVVFRFDDYSAISATDLELKIIKSFRENKLPFTMSVIPYVCSGPITDPTPQEVIPLDSLKGEFLKEAYLDGILEVSLHGYSHQTNTTDKRNSEFSGLDYEVQVEKISKGKFLLEKLTGANISTFVPPWNRYDDKTLQALEELQFSTLSASTIGTADISSPIKFVPNTCSLKMLQDAVNKARTKSSESKPYIIVLFHAYDFKEVERDIGEITFEEFDDIVKWVGEQQDIKVKTIAQVSSTNNDFGVDRFLVNTNIVKLTNLIPPILQPVPDGIYPDSENLIQIRFRLILFYLITLVISFSLIFFLIRILFSKSNSFLRFSFYGLILLLVVAIFYTYYSQSAGYFVCITDTVLLGALGGIAVNLLQFKSKNNTNS